MKHETRCTLAVVLAIAVSIVWMVLAELDVSIWIRFPLAMLGFTRAFRMVEKSHRTDRNSK